MPRLHRVDSLREQLRANSGDISVHTLSPREVDDVTAWRQGQVVFKDTPLREALERFALPAIMVAASR